MEIAPRNTYLGKSNLLDKYIEFGFDKVKLMKIKSPLVNKKEVKALCEAGADELFCGIEPYGWGRRYRNFSINQRSTGANFTKLTDLEKAISIAHRYEVKVHIAVNAFFYLQKQYEMAQQIIKDVLDMGADGIIFADPSLLSVINNKDLAKAKDMVVGTDAVIFNSAGSRFYKRLGATRIVLPRAMTIREMKEVVTSDKFLEYEVFIIHDLCFFIDGFCTYCKEQAGGMKKEGRAKKGVYFFTASRIPGRGYMGGCRTSFRKQRISVRDNKAMGTIRPFSFWMKKHIQGCGACAMYDLKRMGMTVLKVLDRNLPTDKKVEATRFIKEALDLLKNSNIPKIDYIQRCKDLFKKTFKVRCNQYDCYYPSVFLENDD